MLLKNVSNYLERMFVDMEQTGEQEEITVYKEEKAFIEKYQLLPKDQKNLLLIEREPFTRFQGAYIERCNKETDELIAEESTSFLEMPIHYFKNHIEEFMYLESTWFEMVGADAVSFEADSVFGTYDVMLGLKLPKKKEASIKTFITNHLNQGSGTFSLMFNSSDGLWDFNFSLNGLSEYKEDWTINEAYCAIYRFLFQLVEGVEA